MEAGKPFDVVIIDLTIPGGIGGQETLQHLLAMDPQVKAIVSSGYADDPVLANYADYGFKGMVVKPYTRDKLQEVLGASPAVMPEATLARARPSLLPAELLVEFLERGEDERGTAVGAGVGHFGAGEVHDQLLDFLQAQPIAGLDRRLAGRLGNRLLLPAFFPPRAPACSRLRDTSTNSDSAATPATYGGSAIDHEAVPAELGQPEAHLLQQGQALEHPATASRGCRWTVSGISTGCDSTCP